MTSDNIPVSPQAAECPKSSIISSDPLSSGDTTAFLAPRAFRLISRRTAKLPPKRGAQFWFLPLQPSSHFPSQPSRLRVRHSARFFQALSGAISDSFSLSRKIPITSRGASNSPISIHFCFSFCPSLFAVSLFLLRLNFAAFVYSLGAILHSLSTFFRRNPLK